MLHGTIKNQETKFMTVKTSEDLRDLLEKEKGNLFLHQVQADVYHSHPALSQSEIKLAAEKSPRHLSHQRRHPRPATDSMKLGTAAHCAILEPMEFEKRYFAAPKADRRTKEGKAVWTAAEEWAKESGVELLTEGEYESAMEMFAAVREDRDVSRLLENGVAERACFGHLYGGSAKALLDYYRPKTHEIVDLKSTRSAARHHFERDIRSYRYHWQACWYTDLVRELTGETPRFKIVAVENVPPYCAQVFEIKFDLMAIARVEIKRAVELIRKCEETGVWPGYRGEVQEIGAYKSEWEAYKKGLLEAG